MGAYSSGKATLASNKAPEPNPNRVNQHPHGASQNKLHKGQKMEDRSQVWMSTREHKSTPTWGLKTAKAWIYVSPTSRERAGENRQSLSCPKKPETWSKPHATRAFRNDRNPKSKREDCLLIVTPEPKTQSVWWGRTKLKKCRVHHRRLTWCI